MTTDNDDGDTDRPVPLAPAGETKQAAFKRLAEYRMQRLVKHIRQLGHLANRSQYEFEDQQIIKMRAVLNEEIENTFRKFAPQSKEEKLFEF